MAPKPSSASTNLFNTPSIQFPYFHYVSLLGTLTLLLSFTAILLPKSTTLFTTLPPQRTSLDKPQHALLIPITASPKWTLAWLCIGTGICQGWWGGWMRQWWMSYPRLGFNGSPSEKRTEENLERVSAGRKKLVAIRNAFANSFIMSLLYHIVITAFGAPITTHLIETFLLACFISLLTVFVPTYVMSLPVISVFFWRHEGSIPLEWLSVIMLFGQRRIETSLERSLIFPVFSTFFGAWIGSFAIALDWDRPWQAWPLTTSYGALAGYLLGSWLSFLINVTIFFATQDIAQQQQLKTDGSKGVSSLSSAKKKKAANSKEE